MNVYMWYEIITCNYPSYVTFLISAYLLVTQD